MKKFVISFFILSLFCLHLFDSQAKAQTDKPAPQMEEYWDWQTENELKFQERLDDPEITDAAKQFAKEHNCKYLVKNYAKSLDFYKNKGSVYFCVINKKGRYILEHKNKLRFERWYERRRLHKHYYW